MSSPSIIEGEINLQDVRLILEKFQSRLQRLIETDAQEKAERDEQRGLFIEEAKKYVRELHGYSDKIEEDLKTLIASGELLDIICEHDNYLDKYQKLLIDA